MTTPKTQKAVTLSPQAVLMYAKLIAKDPDVIGCRKIKGKNVRKVVGNYQPTGFVSKFTKSKVARNLKKNFFDLETYKLSSLVPEIRLYKAVDNEYVPFYFPTATNVEKLMEGGKPYSTEAVGIQSFNIEFQGTDPYTAKRFLKCNLSIFTDSLENIFKDNPPGYAKLADLFTISRAAQSPSKISVKGGKSSVPKSQTFNARKFEIAATVGYSGGQNILSQAELSDIEETKMSLRMTLIDHTINVNQDGSATIDIEYTARLSGLLTSGFHDVTTAANKDAVSLLAGIHEADAKEAKDIEDPETKKSQLENIERARKMDLNTIVRNEIFGLLEAEDKIHDKNVKDLMSEYYETAGQITPATPNKPEEGQGPPVPKGSNAPTALPRPTGSPVTFVTPAPGDQVISYVNYGDFLDVIFRFLETRLKRVKKYLNSPTAASRLNISMSEITNRIKTIDEKIKDIKMTKVLLADISVPVGSSSSDKPVKINIADIPLSFSLLQNVFFKEFTRLGKNTLTAKKVLDISLKNILPDALSSFSFGGAVFMKNGVNLVSAILTGDKLLPSADNSRNEIPVEKLPAILKRKTLKSHTQENDFYCIFQTPSKMNAHNGKGNESLDLEDNIFHFRIGSDRGLIKNISFTKFDAPFKKEALMIESVNIYDELRMPYSANISMFGNCLFYPGSQIFIDPRAIGFGDARAKNSSSYRLGLGGYYTVLSVSHAISGGQFETNLNCSFGSWPDQPGFSGASVGIMGEVSSENIQGVADVIDGVPGR